MSRPVDPARFEALSAYLDGELAPAEAARLEAELARDPDLRAELNALKLVSNELRVDAEDRRAAAAIGARLRARRRRRRAWLPLLPVAAAAALVLVLTRPAAPGTDVVVTGDDLFEGYIEAVVDLGEAPAPPRPRGDS